MLNSAIVWGVNDSIEYDKLQGHIRRLCIARRRCKQISEWMYTLFLAALELYYLNITFLRFANYKLWLDINSGHAKKDEIRLQFCSHFPPLGNTFLSSKYMIEIFKIEKKRNFKGK